MFIMVVMFSHGKTSQYLKLLGQKQACSCVVIDYPVHVRSECCHVFSLGLAFSVSSCCYSVRPYIIGSYRGSLTKTVQHHHCISLAHTYYLCCTGIDSSKGQVTMRTYVFPHDVPQRYSLTCAYPLTRAAARPQMLWPADQVVLVTWVSSIAHIWVLHVASSCMESRAQGGGCWVPEACSSMKLGTWRLMLLRSYCGSYTSMQL